MTESIRIAVASADDAFSAALCAYLRGREGAHVVESCDVDVIAAAAVETLDAVFLDIRSPDAMARLRRLSLISPTLVLGPGEPNAMIAAFDAGAGSYIDADAAFEEIAAAIRQLVQGHAVVPPPLLGALLRHVITRRRGEEAAREQLEALTKREREVFDLASAGANNATIADRLFISPATARTHVQRVFQKLDLHSRAELIAFAMRCGIYPEETQ